MLPEIRFNKRHAFYRTKDGCYKRGLPVTINGRRFSDARWVMGELWHWYNYQGNNKIVIQGMTKEHEEDLLHLGAFFHPSGRYMNVVTAGEPATLVPIIDAISVHLDGHLFVACRPLFEGRDWRNPPRPEEKTDA